MNWFQTNHNKDVAEVFIFGEIGVGQSAGDFIESIGEAERISLRVDAPGGDSRIAVEVHRFLAGRNVTAEIVGECGSASLILTMAARHIVCAASSRLLVHAPASFAYGNETELIRQAANLRQTTAQWRDILIKRTGQSAATVSEWLAADTWFPSDEALGVGLVDEVRLPVSQEAKSKIAIALGQHEPEMSETEQAFRHWLKIFPPIQTKDRANLIRELNCFAVTKILGPAEVARLGAMSQPGMTPSTVL